MSNSLSFITDLAVNLSYNSIPTALMFMTIIMVLPGVVLGAYAKAYDAYKTMSSEDQDMLLGMSIITLGMGLVCMFALTNMDILVLMTLAGLAAKEWTNWAADINEQDEEEILVRSGLVFEKSFDEAMWAESTKINVETFEQVLEIDSQDLSFFNAYYGYGSANYRSLAVYAQKKLVQSYC